MLVGAYRNVIATKRRAGDRLIARLRRVFASPEDDERAPEAQRIRTWRKFHHGQCQRIAPTVAAWTFSEILILVRRLRVGACDQIAAL
jgi:hypothetical protein